ncbi:hypothetical protein DIZ27_44965 [Streptomyces sp. NWU339]|nr:hypothetical protein DIZ27_44965 [Streptomyces sp. NWU339]
MAVRLRPALEAFGDWEHVHELLARALADGSAAHRLRRAAQDEDLLAGVALLVAETRGAPVVRAAVPTGTIRGGRAGPVAGGAGT